MKLDFICSNFGSRKDGIGHYVYNLVTSLQSPKFIDDIKIYSSSISNNKFARLCSLRMSFNILKSLFSKNNVVIEYPFAECNPLIIIPFLFLSLQKRKRKIVVSLHEYFRVSKLRKFIIDCIIKFFDNFLVTDDYLKSYILDKKKNVQIRPIPSNIINIPSISPSKHFNRFVFFGLINQTKAFDEMIEAWKVFNSSKDNELHIITSSSCSVDGLSSNIHIINNAPDELVDRELKEAAFIILPIKPCVHINNASFMAGIDRGCIPIGVFSMETQYEFCLNMSDYSINSFVNVLKKASLLEVGQINIYRNKVMEIGDSLPSFRSTALIYNSFINN